MSASSVVRRHPALWRGLAGCWVLLGVGVLLGSVDSHSDLPAFFLYFDKAVHLSAWALLASFGPLLLEGQRKQMFAALGLLGASAAIEILQAFIPLRTASVMDLAANAVGIVIGTGAGMLVLSMLGRWSALRRGPVDEGRH
ncbi:MAG: VanZ family protein [Parvibaculum sp.]|nr:VanZ family protein [Parvibaculum sp.]